MASKIGLKLHKDEPVEVVLQVVEVVEMGQEDLAYPESVWRCIPWFHGIRMI
jgi:hypothetical protein